jgi:hypothetical protein
METQNVEIKSVDESNFENIPSQPLFDCKLCICFEYPDSAKKIDRDHATEKKKEWFKKSKELRRRGLATELLKRVIEDLRKENVRAVETFACKDSKIVDNFPSGPIGLYLNLALRLLRNTRVTL